MEKNIFVKNGLQKTWFSRDFPTWDGSDFYSRTRGDLDGSLHEIKKQLKKKFFLPGKGGVSP
jgi:hypothetical protein